MSKLAQKLAGFDKAADDGTVNNAPKDGEGGSTRHPQPEPSDVNKDKDDTDSEQRGSRNLSLKVIGNPQLLKTAQQLFTLAIGEENDDHSRYAEFLIGLDHFLHGFGGKSNLAQQNANQNGDDDGGGDGEDIGDPDTWG